MRDRPKLMTVAEFDAYTARFPDQTFELIEGSLIEVPQPLPLHNYVIVQLIRLLWDFCEPRGLGMAFSDSVDYVLADDLVLIPDVSLVTHARLPELTSRFTIAPDLAVEVASPSNNPRQLQAKALLYLQHGVRVVWLIYPDVQSVDVCKLDGDGLRLVVELLDADDTLAGGDVLPGFEIAVGRLFPKSRE